MSYILFINSLALGFALAMDAFSISVSNGLSDPKMSKKKLITIASTFALFQMLMPLLGWYLIHSLVSLFTFLDDIIPYCALALLTFLGIKMIKCEQECDECSCLTIKLLLMQALATSIDALSVGLTIVKYNIKEALLSSLIIGAVTLIICTFGLILGKRISGVIGKKANIFGGIILIIIGLEIFISNIFF